MSTKGAPKFTSVLMLVLSFPSVPSAAPQEKVIGVAWETRRQVREILLPTKREKPGYFEYRFVLRFNPDDGVESQIVIETGLDGSATVLYYRPTGRKSISSQVDEIFRQTGREDAKEIAARIKIELRKSALTYGQVRNLITEFIQLQFMPVVRTGMEVVHGTTHELWFESGQEHLYYALTWHGGSSEGDPPVLRWMYKVKQAVEANLEKP